MITNAAGEAGEGWNAMTLYYELKDGCMFDASHRKVIFVSQVSVKAFKAKFPGWSVHRHVGLDPFKEAEHAA